MKIYNENIQWKYIMKIYNENKHLYMIRLCPVLLPLLLLLLSIFWDLHFCSLHTEISLVPIVCKIRVFWNFRWRHDHTLTRDLHFCNLHTEISLRSNFQPDPNILKFSMTSPTKHFWTDRQTDVIWLFSSSLTNAS